MFPFLMQGQSLNLDDGPAPWEGGINFGFNRDGYSTELRLIYFKTQYLGLKLGLGVAGEIWELEDWLDDDLNLDYGYGYGYERDYDYAIRFVFNPAIVLRTPRLIHWKQQDAGFFLFGEPGLIMSPGASGSRRAKWFRWNGKAGINMQISQFILTAGYELTNFSLYSGSPESHGGYPVKTDYLTHTFYIGGAVKF
ncbi:MAG: hypothetical protein K2G40_07190 [Muribaculaceae bacterium]|nr:hypothetical protein [Muribaculaceae bacterium]